MGYLDVEKKRAYDRKWQAKRREERGRVPDPIGRARRIARNRAWIEEYRTDKCCSRCGESHVATLDFHHLDPSQKDFSVAKAVLAQYSLATIQKEVKKCIILCANCHRKLHYDERVGPT